MMPGNQGDSVYLRQHRVGRFVSGVQQSKGGGGRIVKEVIYQAGVVVGTELPHCSVGVGGNSALCEPPPFIFIFLTCQRISHKQPESTVTTVFAAGDGQPYTLGVRGSKAARHDPPESERVRRAFVERGMLRCCLCRGLGCPLASAAARGYKKSPCQNKRIYSVSHTVVLDSPQI